ncbi:MAG: hypothetical protein U0903_04100 [Planctomycetales bacterium]
MPTTLTRFLRSITSGSRFDKRRARQTFGPVESCELRVLPATMLGTWNLHLIPPQTPPEGDSGTYELTLQVASSSFKKNGHAKKPDIFGTIDLPGIGKAALSNIKLKFDSFDTSPGIAAKHGGENEPHKGGATQQPQLKARVNSGDVSSKVIAKLSKATGEDPETLKADLIKTFDNLTKPTDYHMEGTRASSPP